MTELRHGTYGLRRPGWASIVNIIRLPFQIMATSVLVFFCHGATQEVVHPKLPAETTINKAAGRGDLLPGWCAWCRELFQIAFA